MSDRSEHKRLLAETLAESSTPDFRAALLDETLRHARRRRQWRQARQAGGVLTLAVLTAVLYLQRPPETLPVLHTSIQQVAQTAAPQSFQIIATCPLPASAVIKTPNFGPITVISSAPAVTEITSSGGHFKFISDQELLALVGNYPVALVRTGPDSEELVFANPDDRKKLFGN